MTRKGCNILQTCQHSIVFVKMSAICHMTHLIAEMSALEMNEFSHRFICYTIIVMAGGESVNTEFTKCFYLLFKRDTMEKDKYEFSQSYLPKQLKKFLNLTDS